MGDITGAPDHIEDILVKLHRGQWFGWSDASNKIYSNLVIHDDQYDKPSQASLEAELATLQAAHPWSIVRGNRDDLLRKSDWTAVTDTALSEADQADWEDYRQALRDIPQTYSDDPENVVWPEAPEA
jgi:hypothetical protein